MNEIKNTKPAVMTDKGPYDTPREKSEDGRYTAGHKGYNLEQQASDAAGTDKEWMEAHKADFNTFEAYLDKTVYTPLFAEFVETFFMPMHIRMNKANPNHVPFIMRTNKYYDQELGIDYVFGSKNEQGYVNQPFVSTDLKVIDTFGKDNQNYNKPMITLNLWKQTYNKETNQLEWTEGSFLNKNHLNKYYTYLCPKSVYTKRDIKNNLYGPHHRFVDPQISEVKLIHVMKEKLDRFFLDKIASNEEYSRALEELKNSDGTSGTKITLPVSGEDFGVDMFVVTGNKGIKSVRIAIPYDAFERKRIKADIAKTIPLKSFRL